MLEPMSPSPYIDARLKRLFWLRNVSIAGQTLGVAIAGTVLGIELPMLALGATIGVLALINLATWLRLKRSVPVSDREILAQLVADVALLTATLYLTGGATNPFVSLYLLPLAIAATVLPMRQTWLMVAVTATAYTALLGWFRAAGPHAHHSPEFWLHVLGMWVNFILSALLIAFFVARMTVSLREREHELARARERALRDEQLVALGTFAAGAAHELGTPLSTMAVVVNDLAREYGKDLALAAELRMLREQIDVCKRLLSSLVEQAGQTRSEGARRVDLRTLVDEAAARWHLMRPETQLSVNFPADDRTPVVIVQETTVQALVTLLNNAADASPERVEIACAWSRNTATLEIRDEGSGLSEKASRLAGRTRYSEKPGRGLGLGLLLAHAAIEHLGGRVDLSNRAEGGAATRVTLPVLTAGSP
jgi:two-component system sensor histidine kinase RegB